MTEGNCIDRLLLWGRRRDSRGGMPKTQRTLPSIRHVAAYNATTPKLGASAKKAALSHDAYRQVSQESPLAKAAKEEW